MDTHRATRYQPVDNGYAITGSRECFNRALFGGHAHDDRAERFFTLAGDTPVFMGAVADWSRHTACYYAKCGVLQSGLALTPGVKCPSFYVPEMDMSSRWFHAAEDTTAIFRDGGMEYSLRRFSPRFPAVSVEISAWPLMPEDGFLVHYRIASDQRVFFCAGCGGMTAPLGRLEYPGVAARHFHASDCTGNRITTGRNRALITDERGDRIWIGASFPVEVAAAAAQAMQDGAPGMFLKSSAGVATPVVARLMAEIPQGTTLTGFLVVLRNEPEPTLDRWLKCADPVALLKQRIAEKAAAIAVHTPDPMFNLTVMPTALAMDAAWHGNTFYHGAQGYHAPFLGWRNWYGPTVIGWHDRVAHAIHAHCADIRPGTTQPERVWYDGLDRPDLDHEGTQYHQLQNSAGHLPPILGGHDIYNMQEVAVSMILHHLEWTGDLALARAIFDKLQKILDWEERILDPDGDGLYQNFLNTWVSDGHSYNGAGCAQASAYNRQANLLLGKIARLLGKPDGVFTTRAAKIAGAIQTRLWLPHKGVLAEHVDTIGNKLVHPAPELATIYLAIECDVTDMFQAWQLRRFTATELGAERTPVRQGRLVYSSNWQPRQYSTRGLFPAENIHLAWAWFKMGWKREGWEILRAITEGHFNGPTPGAISHVLTGQGAADLGDTDFTDVSSMHLRLIVEGVFGMRPHALDNLIEIAPNFPDDWDHASLHLKDMFFSYHRDGHQEHFYASCPGQSRKIFQIPLRSAHVDCVLLNGAPAAYQVTPMIDHCRLTVETGADGLLHLQINHGQAPCPSITPMPAKISAGDRCLVEAMDGRITEWRDDAGMLRDIRLYKNRLQATADGAPGHYTLFTRVQAGDFDAWLPVDFEIIHAPTNDDKCAAGPTAGAPASAFQPLDITKYFNAELTKLYDQEYRTPRPAGYSIGVRLNGRYAWDWNHAGRNAIKIDDHALRQAGGIFHAPSGIGFATPDAGPNVACVAIWDNFPTALRIPMPVPARELALFLIASTNPMQSGVENARLTALARDGSRQTINLVNPRNLDDWLAAAWQQANETVYFSDFNHGMVQRMTLDPDNGAVAIELEAIANEIILGLLAVSYVPA